MCNICNDTKIHKYAGEIAPCPFCGGQAKIIKSGFNFFIWDWLVEYLIQCSICGATTGAKNKRLWQKSKLAAIERWNKRIKNIE